MRLVLALLIALLVPAASAAACPGADSPVRGKRAVKATLCLLNEQRAQHGLGQLTRERHLRRAAVRYARDMVVHRYFSHISRSGLGLATRIRRSGYDGRFVGENLGWGRRGRNTPRHLLAAWMNSPSHRANILEPRFREVGIGVVRGTPIGVRGSTFVTEFGA